MIVSPNVIMINKVNLSSKWEKMIGCRWVYFPVMDGKSQLIIIHRKAIQRPGLLLNIPPINRQTVRNNKIKEKANAIERSAGLDL